jgi:hypothetical protein
MRIGPLEIALIIIIIIAAAIIARIVRGGRLAGSSKNSTVPDTPAGVREDRTSKIWAYFNRTGIALVIIGFLALLAAASFFRLVLQSYLWSTIVIAIGLLLVFLSRKKR